MQKNNSDYFPALNLSQLRLYAKLWQEDYSNVPIKRVLLYRYHSKYMKYIKKMKDPNSKGPRYVVVFEVTGLELERYQERHFHYSPDILESLPWKEFMDEMDNILKNTYREREKSIFIYGYDGFELVYNQPQDDFYKEWTFIAVSPESPLPDCVVDTFSLVLFPTHDPEKKSKGDVRQDLDTFPQDVIDYVALIKPLVNRIYNSLKNGPGWNKGDKPEDKNARMEDALNFYDENKDELGLLNRGLLEDSALYDRSYTQDKRDIVGRILKKAVELNDLGQHSARKLYKIC